MEIESLEDEECSGKLSEVDNAQLRDIVEADPLTTTWEVAEECNINHSMVIWHLKQIGKVKKRDKRVIHELTTNQNSHHFQVSSFLTLLNNNKSFLNQIVICDKKWNLFE